MEKTAITCLTWVPRGKCRSKPIKEADVDDDEMREAYAAFTGGAVGGASSSSSKASAKSRAAATASAVNMQGLEEFNLENYDDSDDDNGMQLFSVLKEDGELAKGLDPHLTGDPNSDSDGEDYELSNNDNVFIAASCEEDQCSLEMYVYDEEEASIFVHHDIMISAYPLCIEWLSSYNSTTEGSFAALGLIDHTIQIWDLDRQDPMVPNHMLGESKKGRKKGSTKRKGRTGIDEVPTAHDGAVLSINGSAFNRNVLVSGGADHIVKVWDVCQNATVHTYTHHENKVQVVKWHPTEQAVLLSAAFDRRLALLDVRQPGAVAKVELPAEAEDAIWHRHKPFECIASADNGGVACYDVRKVVGKAPVHEQVLWSLHAHDVACTAVADAPAPNLMVTAGLDGEAKVWNIEGGKPRMVYSKSLQAGPLFACQACPDYRAVMSFSGKCPVIWDLSSEELLFDLFKLGPTTCTA